MDFWQIIGAIAMIALAVIVIGAAVHLVNKWRADEEYIRAEAALTQANAQEMRMKISKAIEVGGLILFMDGRDHDQLDGTHRPYIIIERVERKEPPPQLPAGDDWLLAKTIVWDSRARNGLDSKKILTDDEWCKMQPDKRTIPQWTAGTDYLMLHYGVQKPRGNSGTTSPVALGELYPAVSNRRPITLPDKPVA